MSTWIAPLIIGAVVAVAIAELHVATQQSRQTHVISGVGRCAIVDDGVCKHLPHNEVRVTHGARLLTRRLYAAYPIRNLFAGNGIDWVAAEKLDVWSTVGPRPYTRDRVAKQS